MQLSEAVKRGAITPFRRAKGSTIDSKTMKGRRPLAKQAGAHRLWPFFDASDDLPPLAVIKDERGHRF